MRQAQEKSPALAGFGAAGRTEGTGVTVGVVAVARADLTFGDMSAEIGSGKDSRAHGSVRLPGQGPARPYSSDRQGRPCLPRCRDTSNPVRQVAASRWGVDTPNID